MRARPRDIVSSKLLCSCGIDSRSPPPCHAPALVPRFPSLEDSSRIRSSPSLPALLLCVSILPGVYAPRLDLLSSAIQSFRLVNNRRLLISHSNTFLQFSLSGLFASYSGVLICHWRQHFFNTRFRGSYSATTSQIYNNLTNVRVRTRSISGTAPHILAVIA